MKEILIIGNGPSTKDLDFSKIKIDTFGMNNSYKIYDKINFYPTYFGSFDKRHCTENKDAYCKLILHSPIKKFFFCKDDLKDYPENIKTNNKVYLINSKSIKRPNQLYWPESFDNYIHGGNSGINCLLSAYLLGYKDIYIIGCDASYDKRFDENTINNKALETINQNYFIDDYYSKESDRQFQANLRFHRPFWKVIIKIKPKELNIFNCSPISKIKDLLPFKKLDLVY